MVQGFRVVEGVWPLWSVSCEVQVEEGGQGSTRSGGTLRVAKRIDGRPLPC